MTNNENTTPILEQCRADMDALAALGEEAMREAITKAETSVRACTQDWKQASRAVELTFRQEKAVEDARLTGEEKLAQAISEEEDARTAMDTVLRMIEDAATVSGAANTDIAHILQKAETVLGETAIRARSFYSSKKTQRGEIENAMRRLYATEKSVLYTMAKAERNEKERLLVKLTAEKRLEVSKAEFQVLSLQDQQARLTEDRQAQRDQKEQVYDDIESSQQRSLQLEQEAADAAAAYQQQTQLCQDEHQRVLADLSARDEAAAAEQNLAKINLDAAAADATQREHASADADAQLVRLREETNRELAAAQEAHDREIAALEGGIARLRTQSIDYQAIHSSAVCDRDAARQEAERLRGIANDCLAKATNAEADEKSVREAADTANRLATNATKIRESISSESSQLLLHAQEVLLEAAASAGQLMEEKRAARLSAESESHRATAEADIADASLAKAEKRVADAKEAWDKADEALSEAIAQAENRRAELKEGLAQVADSIAQRCRAAAETSADLRAEADQAAAGRRQAQDRYQQIEAALAQLAEERRQAEADTQTRLAQLKQSAEDEQARLAQLKQQEETNLSQLRSRLAGILAAIEQLETDLAALALRIEESTQTVCDLSLTGAAALEEARAEVERCTQTEVDARQAAEAAVLSTNALLEAEPAPEEAPLPSFDYTEPEPEPEPEIEYVPDLPPEQPQEPEPEWNLPLTFGAETEASLPPEQPQWNAAATLEAELPPQAEESPEQPEWQEPVAFGAEDELPPEPELPEQSAWQDEPAEPVSQPEPDLEAEAEIQLPPIEPDPLIPEDAYQRPWNLADLAAAVSSAGFADQMTAGEAAIWGFDAPPAAQDETPADYSEPEQLVEPEPPVEVASLDDLQPLDDGQQPLADYPLDYPVDDQPLDDYPLDDYPLDEQPLDDYFPEDQPLIPEDDLDVPPLSDEEMEYTTRIEILGQSILENTGELNVRPAAEDWLMAKSGSGEKPAPAEAPAPAARPLVVDDNVPVPPEAELNIASLLGGFREGSGEEDAPIINEAVLHTPELELELPPIDTSSLSSATVSQPVPEDNGKRRWPFFSGKK